MKTLMGIFMTITIITAIIGCDAKKEDDDTLMLLLIDQMSWNCVKIEKNSGTEYTARGYKFSKGECSDNTQYYINSSYAKSASDAEYDSLIAAAQGDNCSTLKSSLTNDRNALTAVSIEALANANTNKCYSFSPNANKPMVYCIDMNSVDAYKANANNIYRYYIASDTSTDMAVSLAYYKNDANEQKLITGFTDEAINALIPSDSAFLNASRSAGGYIYLNNVGTKNCVKDILTANTALKEQITRHRGKSIDYGITATEAAAVRSVVVINLECKYGSSFTIPTNFEGICPSNYPTW